jgi:hypothetical protein
MYSGSKMSVLRNTRACGVSISGQSQELIFRDHYEAIWAEYPGIFLPKLPEKNPDYLIILKKSWIPKDPEYTEHSLPERIVDPEKYSNHIYILINRLLPQVSDHSKLSDFLHTHNTH